MGICTDSKKPVNIALLRHKLASRAILRSIALLLEMLK